jgi:hypothetical protein
MRQRPPASRRQTMRKRTRLCPPPRPVQLAVPSVAAMSPSRSVVWATMRADERGVICRAWAVLLVRLPVVHRHRLARLEHDETDSELREVRLALLDHAARAIAIHPRSGACIQREPAVATREQAVLGRFEWRLGNHARRSRGASRPGSVRNTPSCTRRRSRARVERLRLGVHAGNGDMSDLGNQA